MFAPRPHLATLVNDFERNASDWAVVAFRGLRRRRTSYHQLAILCRRFAAELVARGISKGDRVVICGENGAEWIAAFFGCVLRGVLPVPLDLTSSQDFAQRVVAEVSPRLIVGDAERLPLFNPIIVPWLALEDLETSLTTDAAQAIETLNATDPLQIVFTSGTTSQPKGVVHTHRNVLASLEPIERELAQYRKYERVFHPLRFLHALPLSHVFGQFMGLWIPSLLSAEVHFESRLVAWGIIERIREERISVLACVPRVLDLLQQHLTSRLPDLPTRVAEAANLKPWQRWWRFRDAHRLFGFKFWSCVCGGASLPPQIEEFWGRLGFVLVQGYGMTETTALVSLNHPFKAARGTVGKVLPGREVRIAEDGEVLVRGETVSNLVWQRGATASAESPWLATGDLASFDPNGNLRFRGRKKDTIVTAAGLNIYPDDLEAALLAQSGVLEAAVLDQHGSPLAVLRLAPHTDPAAAIASANGMLAPFQQMHRWSVWRGPGLPRTSTGKVLKREIAAQLASESKDSSAPQATLDSLARVELQAQLEQKYGVTLDDAAMQTVNTEQEAEALLSAQELRGPVTSQHIYPKWPWSPPMRLIRTIFLEGIALPLVRLLAKPKIESRVVEWPRQPALLVANHVTAYDAALILVALPRHMRSRVAIAMSGELLLHMRNRTNQGSWLSNQLAPVGYLLITGLFNVFPLPQGAGFRRSFEHAGQAVDRGFSVLIFPEGRRSADGTPQRFKAGAGLLWNSLQTPAVALHLEGLGAIKAAGVSWFRTGCITVSANALLESQIGRSPEEATRLLEQSVFSST